HPSTSTSSNDHVADLDNSDDELKDLTFHNIVDQFLTNHIPLAEDTSADASTGRQSPCISALSPPTTHHHPTLDPSAAPLSQPLFSLPRLQLPGTLSMSATGQPPTTSSIQARIPLKNLFDYSQYTPDIFESVWAGRVKSLIDELLFYDISVAVDTN
ncbi:hypothetical protein PAXRUDRAFT_151489, partial [Paxillus rubicundulus Ve08.2h10]